MRLEGWPDDPGRAARSPQSPEPEFDLAWDRKDVVYVAEVKSLSDAGSGDRQLRLGIGQVLDYQALMAKIYPEVRAVLVLERQPVDARGTVLCESHEVKLVWPATFATLI